MKNLDNFIFEKLKLNKDIKITNKDNWTIKDAEEGDFIQWNGRELYFIFDSLNTNHHFSDYLNEHSILSKAVYNARINVIRVGLNGGLGDIISYKDKYILAPEDKKEIFIKKLDWPH